MAATPGRDINVSTSPEAASAIAAAEMFSHFLGNSGVVLRVWECNELDGAPGMTPETNTQMWLKSPVPHLDRGTQLLFDCAASELTRHSRFAGAASLLRYDVPVALWHGGRRVAAEDQAGDMPRDRYAHWRVLHTRLGFVFHSFHTVPSLARGSAVPHDAWGVDRNQSDLTGLLCPANWSSAQYVAARRDYHKRGKMWPPWPFNCRYADWGEMLKAQAAFTLDQAARPSAMREIWAQREGDVRWCGSGIRAYNQVHLRWHARSVRALFYVNDSLTPLQADNASAGAREDLIGLAQRAAFRSWQAAQLLVQKVPELYGVPVVQFKFTDECSNLTRVAERVQRLRHQHMHATDNHFFLPAPGLRGGY